MKVTVAIDSFKGSLSTFEAGEAAKRGVLRAYPDALVDVCPLADGGEGTVDAVVSALGGELVEAVVTGPLGGRVTARYGVVREKGLAVMEMSAAAGITLVPEDLRDPLETTTYGVGEMIAHAIDNGCRKLIVGIGGSATNDGGVGMLQALGFGFFDCCGREIERKGRGLESLCRISSEGVRKELSECTFLVACDVENPLCGERGCSAVYGPQKGATPQTVAAMDAWLENYGELTKKYISPRADAEAHGAGAAGGMGFAFLSYLGGSLESGIELVIRETALEEKISAADLVITGEGRLDFQSSMGKAPVGVARTAKKHGKTVIALSGCVGKGAEECNRHGIDAFFPIIDAARPLDALMDKAIAEDNLSRTAEQALRLIKSVLKN